MARVTSKLQVTIPKAIALHYGIEPGTEIEWLPAGDAIRIVPPAGRRPRADRSRQLELFDRATERQAARQVGVESAPNAIHRGWEREDLYQRGLSD
jgi:bifunctional DNA-binding transcriptional regulator/antitoxin component of YhaV-PrlF toxin-antitoxin module